MSARRRTLRSRAGFTIIELVVAIIILSVGILAMATGSAGVLRQMRAGNQAALASMAAQSRLETLRGQGCTNLANGSATTRGMSEKWTVTWLSQRTRALTESVTYVPRAGVSRKLAVKTVVPCI